MTEVFRVFSPSRGRTVLATTNHGKAEGRAHALNRGTTTGGGVPDWTVQHANPEWEADQ